MTLHLNAIEVTFAVTAFVVCSISLYSLRQAILDQTALISANVNGPRKLMADGNVREEVMRLGVGSVMFVAAICALFLEPPPPTYQVAPQSLVFVVAWCCVGFLMIISSTLERLTRRKLIRAVHEQDVHTRRSTDLNEPPC